MKILSFICSLPGYLIDKFVEYIEPHEDFTDLMDKDLLRKFINGKK